MKLSFKFQPPNFGDAASVFAEELNSSLNTLGKKLEARVRAKMREDTGKEKRNVKSKVGGSRRSPVLTVSGDTPQTLVDEYGRGAGARPPPSGPGSLLYKWVGRKGMVGASDARTRKRTSRFERRTVDRQTGRRRTSAQSAAKRQATIAFLVARKIARTGIPARKPFERTFDESQVLIQSTIDGAVTRALRRINST